MLALTAYVASLSKGVPLAASAEGAAEGEGKVLKKRSSLKKMNSIQRVVRRASDLVSRVRTASAASSEASEDRDGETEAPESPAAAV